MRMSRRSETAMKTQAIALTLMLCAVATISVPDKIEGAARAGGLRLRQAGAVGVGQALPSRGLALPSPRSKAPVGAKNRVKPVVSFKAEPFPLTAVRLL